MSENTGKQTIFKKCSSGPKVEAEPHRVRNMVLRKLRNTGMKKRQLKIFSN